MAEAAKRIDHFPAHAVAPQGPTWSGEVHGPVAALHQAIQAGFADGRLDARLTEAEAERPVDRLLRIASRATGWTVLAAAFVATAAVIF